MRPIRATPWSPRVPLRTARRVLGTLTVLVVLATAGGRAQAHSVDSSAPPVQPQQKIVLLTQPHEVVTRMEGTGRSASP